MAEAYPLHWPEGWPRTPEHRRDDGAKFRMGNDAAPKTENAYVSPTKPVTFERALRLLRDELARLNAKSVVISTNLPLRLNGYPYSQQRRIDDPGVAVYFVFKGKPMVMAQDAFTNIAANVRSLGLAVEAMRQLERHGGGTMMERAFAGFSALPPPEGSKPKRPWWEVMRFPVDPAERELLSVSEVEARFRTLAMRLHPDKGGTADAMAELSQAKDDAVAELEGP